MTHITPLCDARHKWLSGSLFCARLSICRLFHMNHRQGFTVLQGDGDRLHGNVAPCSEKLGSRQRCAHFVAAEACGVGGLFASLENSASNALSRPVRVYKEGTNLGGIVLRIQQSVLPACPMITAVKSFAFAPSAAPDY